MFGRAVMCANYPRLSVAYSFSDGSFTEKYDEGNSSGYCDSSSEADTPEKTAPPTATGLLKPRKFTNFDSSD